MTTGRPGRTRQAQRRRVRRRLHSRADTDHQQTVQLLEFEVGSGQDPALKQFAVQTLPVVMRHLQMAQAIATETEGVASRIIPSEMATHPSEPKCQRWGGPSRPQGVIEGLGYAAPDLFVSNRPALFRIQHRGLAGLDHMLWPANRMRRVGGDDLAGDQPVKQHADRGERARCEDAGNSLHPSTWTVPDMTLIW